MAETIETDYQFRGHHAPGRGFELLNMIYGTSRDAIVDKFSESQDWVNSEWAIPIGNLLQNDYRTKRQGDFLRLNNQYDEYTKDLMGSEYWQRLSQVDKMVNIEIEDIKNLFFGNPYQIVTIGDILDNQCHQCAIGKHCSKIIDGQSEDTKLALQIKSACDVLNIQCTLEYTSDNIFEKDKEGNLKKARVATLGLGDLRDFILRRIIYCKEQEEKLELKERELKLLYDQNRNNESVLNELCQADTDRLMLMNGRLSWIEISSEEEIILQKRIDEARK